MSNPLGNGEIAEVFERVITFGMSDGDRPLVVRALRQLRQDTRALKARECLQGHVRNLSWREASDRQNAITDAFVILNWGEVPEWFTAYEKPERIDRNSG